MAGDRSPPMRSLPPAGGRPRRPSPPRPGMGSPSRGSGNAAERGAARRQRPGPRGSRPGPEEVPGPSAHRRSRGPPGLPPLDGFPPSTLGRPRPLLLRPASAPPQAAASARPATTSARHPLRAPPRPPPSPAASFSPGPSEAQGRTTGSLELGVHQGNSLREALAQLPVALKSVLIRGSAGPVTNSLEVGAHQGKHWPSYQQPRSRCSSGEALAQLPTALKSGVFRGTGPVPPAQG